METLSEAIKEIKNYNTVKSWLNDLSASSKTGYVYGLADFCITNNLNPNQMLDIIYQEEEKRLPSWERSINKWFEKYDEHCKNQNYCKSTRNIRRTIVNGFINYHELPKYTPKGSRRKIEGLRIPKKRAHINREEIQDLISASKSFKLRAMILTQCSSGLASVDMLNLKIKDFEEGLIEIYDDTTNSKRKICQLNLVRIKTKVEFTTFLSEEAVEAIEKYLQIERIEPQPEDALFSQLGKNGISLGKAALQENYRKLNDYMGWKQEKKGDFRKVTSHMMRKFFNTQLINAGMPEEIREHMMGHKYNNPVRGAYFLPDPVELKKVYIKYMEYITISEKLPINMDEFGELKVGFENLEKENKILLKQINEIVEHIKKDVHPDEEILQENKNLKEAYEWTYHENKKLKSQIEDIES